MSAPPITPRRDARPVIYLVLDQILAVALAYLLAAVIPNRHASAVIHLWAVPVCMQLMALGCAVRLVARPARWRIGWWLSVAGGSLLIAVTILLIIRVIVSAAFLAGVYGAFGKAAALTSLVAVALVVEVVALVPLFQVKYLMSRSGRRAFALST